MDEVTMIPVTSSNIEAIGHIPERLLLRVTFKSGQTWEYAGVTAEVFNRMLNAESVGKFFSASIRGHYEGKPVQ